MLDFAVARLCYDQQACCDPGGQFEASDSGWHTDARADNGSGEVVSQRHPAGSAADPSAGSAKACGMQQAAEKLSSLGLSAVARGID